MYDCVICQKGITGSYVRDEWGNVAHATCQPACCYSCGRIVAKSSSKGGVQHPDGRVICSSCYSACIKRDHQMNIEYEKVRKELTNVGFKKLPKQMDIRLVDTSWMKRRTGSSNVEGLTHISRLQTGFNTIHISQTIYMLNYLNKLHFKAVLAHELLHVWVAQRGLELGNYEEALCNIGSTYIYNLHQPSKLASVLNDRMKINQDPNYGIRFMELKLLLKQVGWEEFIRQVSG